MKVDAFNDQGAANLAVSSGRAQVGMADSPVAAYIVCRLEEPDPADVAAGLAARLDAGLNWDLVDVELRDGEPSSATRMS